MAVQGKLEVTIKINELPAISSKDKNGWVTFELDCEGRIFTATVKPKVFKKLEDAQANFPMWVAAIAGKMGEATETGFVLLEPNIQVFEKKPKEAKPAEVASTS
ncbi:MAG: fertility inhibition FinO-like protein [Pseudanabaena sp. M165S2SP1A06QC]|nr:fertility inhibition FinO-like protein [Pseudanabaena sp. M165S2SP1A06QC]